MKKILLIIIPIILISLSIGCIESNEESEYPVHIIVSNQRFEQYSNISVNIDNDYYFNVTAITGDGHTHYYDNLTLSTGDHNIKVFEHDTNTSVIINLPETEEMEDMNFKVDKEIWIVVSFWTHPYDIEILRFRVDIYDKNPAFT